MKTQLFRKENGAHASFLTKFLYIAVIVLMLLAAAMLLINKIRECFIFLVAGAVTFAYAEYSEKKSEEKPPAETKEAPEPAAPEKLDRDEWVKSEQQKLEAEIKAKEKK